MSERLPTRVSLPEVSEYTDDIMFGNLDFPQGFDQSSLLVDLRLMNRVRAVAGLRKVNVYVGNQNNEAYDVSVSTFNADGTATMGAIGKRSKKPLSRGTAQHTGLGLVGSPEAHIRVNNTELENRIEASDRYSKGVFDATARAKFLNKAIKQGLTDASFEASFTKSRALLSGVSYPYWIGVNILGGVHETSLIENVAVNTMIAHTFFSGLWAITHSSNRQEFIDGIKNYRYSLTYGLTPDRFLAASALLVGRSIVRAES